MDGIYGNLKILAFAVVCHPDNGGCKRHKRIQLASIECYYRDAERVFEHFKMLNPHITKNTVAQFEFRRLI